jgi:hypothetical protein
MNGCLGPLCRPVESDFRRCRADGQDFLQPAILDIKAGITAVRLLFEIMYTQIDEAPPGYPSVAALFSKDNDFAIFRRFRYLNTRNLLYLQAELIALETKLEDLDRSLFAGAQTDALKSWEAFSKDEDRRKLARSIREALRDYSKEKCSADAYIFSHGHQMKRCCSLTLLQIYRVQAVVKSASSTVG